MSRAFVWKDPVTVHMCMARAARGEALSAEAAGALEAADARMRSYFLQRGRSIAKSEGWPVESAENFIIGKHLQMMYSDRGWLDRMVRDFEPELASRVFDPGAFEDEDLEGVLEVLGRRCARYITRALTNALIDEKRRRERDPLALRVDATPAGEGEHVQIRFDEVAAAAALAQEEAVLERSEEARDAVQAFTEAYCAQHRNPEEVRQDWDDLVDFQTGELTWPEIYARRGCDEAEHERLLRRQTRLRKNLIAFVSEALKDEVLRADAELALDVLDRVLRTRAPKRP